MSYFIPPGPPPSRLMASRSAPGKKRQSTGNTAPAIPSEHATLLATIADEVRDSGRVQRQGQEEDLRDALGRMMLRVEELCTLLKATAAAKSELETQLAIAQSNLKMSLANNDMLEDALKRSSGSKDVGWRRSAATPTPDAQSQSQDSAPAENAEEEMSPPPTATVSSAPATQDSRFFRFRFTSGRTTPQPPGSPPLSASRSTPGHLTSASLPSLVPLAAPEPNTKELDDAKAELEQARAALEAERAALARSLEDKRNLEEELESLSQALFEEANKMVAQERIKRAEAEEELGEARAEKDALRAALRLIEQERLRQSDSENERIRASHSRSSSRVALRSPREKPSRLSEDQAGGTDSDEVEAVLVSSPGSPPSEPGELVETPTEGAAEDVAEPIKPPPRTSSMFLNGVVLEPSPSITPEATTPEPDRAKAQTIIYAPNSSDSIVSPWAQRPSASSEDMLPRTPFTPPPPDEDSPWR
ncbi:hypothetical protein PENSPDRAFT_671459 [Peniophora sp. CONT]|nr:hypothetical protein PENSPDRAFT_671459 [Peniophora sp. CONT]